MQISLLRIIRLLDFAERCAIYRAQHLDAKCHGGHVRFPPRETHRAAAAATSSRGGRVSAIRIPLLACTFAPREDTRWAFHHRPTDCVERARSPGTRTYTGDDDGAPEDSRGGGGGGNATVRKVAERRDIVANLPAAVTVGGRQVASNYCKQLRLMRRLTPPAEGWRERGCKCADAE